MQYKYTGQMLKLSAAISGENVDLQVASPLVSKTAVQLFAEYYDKCVGQKAKLLITFQPMVWTFRGAKLIEASPNSITSRERAKTEIAS